MKNNKFSSLTRDIHDPGARYTYTEAKLYLNPMYYRSKVNWSCRATPSKKYSSRSNAGDVVASLGDVDNVKWQGSGNRCSITRYDPLENLTKEERDNLKDLNRDFKYMFQKLTDKAAGIRPVKAIELLRDVFEFIQKQLFRNPPSVYY